MVVVWGRRSTRGQTPRFIKRVRWVYLVGWEKVGPKKIEKVGLFVLDWIGWGFNNKKGSGLYCN